MRPRVAFVVQRYGLEVAGGAELHCRWLAERLARHLDVDVLTTCALDYQPWDNHYPAGKTQINGIAVDRFPVDQVRQHLAFDALTSKVFGESHGDQDEIDWVKMLGPHSTGLLARLSEVRDVYALIVFFTYQYFPSVFGLPLVPEKAILVPTAHDDRTLDLEIYRSVFRLPRFIVYNTETERDLVQWRFGNESVPSAVVGTGVETPKAVNPELFRQRHRLTGPLLTYVGRIDPAKGCDVLFEHFARFKAERHSDLTLLVIGRPEMAIPRRPDIFSMGFISEQEKFDAIAASSVVVLPSEQESLSMANLEAWLMGVPVLANGFCQVLKDNCIRSNGGLYYTSYEEFAGCLDVLLADQRIRQAIGAQGQRYCQENYAWDVVESRYLEIIEHLLGRA
jgi:glycosyltransferase involved in cell wall biosynthesis